MEIARAGAAADTAVEGDAPAAIGLCKQLRLIRPIIEVDRAGGRGGGALLHRLAIGQRERVLGVIARRCRDGIDVVIRQAADQAAALPGLAGGQGEVTAVAIALAAGAEVAAELHAVEARAQDEVDHPADRIGPVHRRGAVAEHLDAFDHAGRNGVDVVVSQADAVDQHQRALVAQAAQRDRRGAGAAAVVGIGIGGIAGDGWQFLQQIAHGRLAGGSDLFLAHGDHRIGGFGIHATQARAGDDHAVQRLRRIATSSLLRRHRRNGTCRQHQQQRGSEHAR